VIGAAGSGIARAGSDIGIPLVHSLKQVVRG
jgi:hypothetical protein